MTDPSFNPITIQAVSLRSYTHCQFDVLRLDKVHSIISGNKWFKLKYYIQEAKDTKKSGIITFGGAFSNHLLATAAACRLHNLQSIGLVRGEQPAKLSSTLIGCKELGMELIFMNRDDYREKKIPTSVDVARFLPVNEGGYGKPGVNGISEIISQFRDSYTHFVCSVGTGTTMAGIVNAAISPTIVIGISALKNNQDLDKAVDTLSSNNDLKRIIHHDYHFGGYAKHPEALIKYMNDLYVRTGIPTDIVYTSKMFYAVEELAMGGYFPPNSNLLIIHSGGLQGNNSLEKGTLMY